MILFRALHKRFIDTWSDYEKGSSFQNGARWNEALTPVLYMSSNVQNAMLELSNYAQSPRMANGLFVIGVFESPSLRLKEVQPSDLPEAWEQYPFHKDTQAYGTKYLQSSDYDGLIVPSCAINPELSSSALNEVRRSVYANVVVNPEKPSLREMRMIDTFEPMYSNRMFGA